MFDEHTLVFADQIVLLKIDIMTQNFLFYSIYFLKYHVSILFTGTNITTHYNAYFGESSGPYHLDNVNCGGHEVDLTACSHQYASGGVYNNDIDVHNCAPGKEAAVKCDGMRLSSNCAYTVT